VGGRKEIRTLTGGPHSPWARVYAKEWDSVSPFWGWISCASGTGGDCGPLTFSGRTRGARPTTPPTQPMTVDVIAARMQTMPCLLGWAVAGDR